MSEAARRGEAGAIQHRRGHEVGGLDLDWSYLTVFEGTVVWACRAPERRDEGDEHWDFDLRLGSLPAP